MLTDHQCLASVTACTLTISHTFSSKQSLRKITKVCVMQKMLCLLPAKPIQHFSSFCFFYFPKPSDALNEG